MIVVVARAIDSCADRSRLGQRAVVDRVLGEADGHNGEADDDPSLVLRFADGTTDLFWPEELEVVA